MNDGKCSQSECEQDFGCAWCESDNCDKTCPCVPIEQGCTAYGEGTFCQFDEQCAEGLQCSGHKGGFIYEQACCPEGEEWDPSTSSCGRMEDEISQYQDSISNFSQDIITWGDNSDNFYEQINGCLLNSCSDGDVDCDGDDDDICFAEPEICDGKDNDYDGVVDDGVCSQNCASCGNGWFSICDKAECESLGGCNFKKGWIGGSCTSVGGEEKCIDEVCDNSLDDNCDGNVDEGCAYEDYYDEDSSVDIGLKKRGDFYCSFNGQCNPGLECKGINSVAATALHNPSTGINLYGSGQAYEIGGGGCCLPWEDWNSENLECFDTRIDRDTIGCENDDECMPGLHCSWDGWFSAGACCPEGTEFDTEAGICTECGVIALPGDSDYCSQKAEIGCSCDTEEGNCADDNECYSGNYCSSTKRWWSVNKWGSYDICCMKGTLYNPETGQCDITEEEACSGLTKEECFANGASCCFENNECGICTDINRNEKFCASDFTCCDSDSGCNMQVDLACVAGGVCCYPWEEMNENTGRCTIECPDCDDDKDGYSNEFEMRVYSNPLWDYDTPTKRIPIQPCGSMFEVPGIYDLFISGTTIGVFTVADFTNPESLGPSKLGMFGGVISGALGGIWDDLQLIPMLLNGVWKLLEFSAFASSDPESAAVRSGYTWEQTSKVVSSIWSEFGDMIVETYISGLDSISAQGEDINVFFHDECNEVTFIKAYTRGYVAGYIIEQIAMAFVGVAEVKTAVQAGFGATKVGGAVVRGLGAIEKLIARILEPIAGFTKGVIDNVVVSINELAIRTIRNWGDEAIEGFGRIIKSGGKRYARELISEMGETGLRRASKKIASMSAKHGDEAVELFIKSKIGREALKSNWAANAQEVLLKVLKETGEDKLDNIVAGMTKTARKKIGIKLNKIASFSDEAAELALKSPAAGKLLTELPDEAIEPLVKGLDNLPSEVTSMQRHIDDVGEIADAEGITNTLKAMQGGGEGNTFEVFASAQINREGIGGGVQSLGKTVSDSPLGVTEIDAILDDGTLVQFKWKKADGKPIINPSTGKSTLPEDEVRLWLEKLDNSPTYKNSKKAIMFDEEPSPEFVRKLNEMGIDDDSILYYNKHNDNILSYADDFENEEVIARILSVKQIDNAVAAVGKGLAATEKATLKRVFGVMDSTTANQVIKKMKDIDKGSYEFLLKVFKNSNSKGDEALSHILDQLFSKKSETLIADRLAEFSHLGGFEARGFVGGVPYGATDGKILFRGIPRKNVGNPDFALKDGLWAEGVDTDAVAHIMQRPIKTNYLSGSKSPSSAIGFAKGDGYIFIYKSNDEVIDSADIIATNYKKIINPQPDYTDTALHGYEGEFEMLTPHKIDSEDIIGYVEISGEKILKSVWQ